MSRGSGLCTVGRQTGNSCASFTSSGALELLELWRYGSVSTPSWRLRCGNATEDVDDDDGDGGGDDDGDDDEAGDGGRDDGDDDDDEGDDDDGGDDDDDDGEDGDDDDDDDDDDAGPFVLNLQNSLQK